MAYGSATAEAGEELKNDKGLPDGTPTQETMVVETQDALEMTNGTQVPLIPESTPGVKPRSSLLLQMDKHRRMCQERNDIYLCEVDILAGLRKTQSAKLRELNELKAKVTLMKQSHHGPRSSKKAIKEMGAEDNLKRVQQE